MKDFIINEAADEAASNFPGIPKDVVRHLANYALEQWIDIIKNKKGRIMMRNCDIHTIYFEIKPDEQRAKLADLNEAQMLTQEQEDLTLLQRLVSEKKILPRKIKRLNRRLKRIHSPRPYTGSPYPK